MENKADILAKLVKCLSNVEFAYIPNTEEAIIQFLKDSTHNIFEMVYEQMLPAAYFRPLTKQCVFEYHSIGGVCYLAYLYAKENKLLFLGPFLTQPFSRELARGHLRSSGFGVQTWNGFFSFCQDLPVTPLEKQHQVMQMLIEAISGEAPPYPTQRVSFPVSGHVPLQLCLPEQAKNIQQMRQVELRYENSAALIEAVKQGNYSLALHFFGRFVPDQDISVRSDNLLRNVQNYCIIVNTQIRYALEGSGIHPYRLDSFSESIAKEIEKLKTVKKAQSFIMQIIEEYCCLVQEHRYPNMKPVTRLAVAYIKNHLADNITVKDTAKALTMNANYLSGQFHADMGITFIDFLNQERVQQAAGLLQYTKLQIQEIALAVGYNNTSYFAKQFSRVYGMSPRSYRLQIA